jgi:integrase
VDASLLPTDPVIVDENWSKLKQLVLDALPARNSKRAYGAALDAFYRWYFTETRLPFSKAVVQEYRSFLEARGYAPLTIAQQLSALRKLATEAADNGLLDSQIAAGVCRIRAPRHSGRRIGYWLSAAQAAALIQAPADGSLKCLRDRAIFAVALGCGLRRAEVAALTVEHLQEREGRWIIADLAGKNGRIRTVPIPDWVKSRLDAYFARNPMVSGPVFRPINKADAVNGDGMTAQAIYEVVKAYATRLHLPLSPHDLRRTFAKLAHAGDAPVEQIQYSLGHASLTTTERYLGLEQNLRDAPGDRISLPLEPRGL